MGQMIEIGRPDGGTCPAYLSAHSLASSGPGLVVLQEWWGLNDQIKSMADRFAQLGYRALVPDLFRGKHAKDASEASHLMSALNFVDAAEQDVQGCVNHLRQSSGRCGVTGFCMGGALTIVSAVRVKGMDAGVCFYGIPPKAVANPSDIAIPMLFHFAEEDDWCTPAVVSALDADLKQSKSKYALFSYPAQHAFMNEARPEVYDAKVATLAWERSLKFFEHTLKA